VSWLGINCPGVYRRLIACPRNFSWKFFPSPSAPLTAASPTHKPGTPTTGLTTKNIDSNVEINFDLDTSTYATMLVREITKNIY